MRGYARKVDLAQEVIVAALRMAGWEVHIIGEPCDLLCFKAGVWRTLEVKSPSTKTGAPAKRKDQARQAEFCERTGTPKVTTAIAALEALGAI